MNGEDAKTQTSLLRKYTEVLASILSYDEVLKLIDSLPEECDRPILAALSHLDETSIHKIVKDEVRGVMLSALGEKLGNLVCALWLDLASRRRLSMLVDLPLALRERALAVNGLLLARVLTAVELTTEELAKTKRLLAEASGREVEVFCEVDSSILSGYQLTINGRTLDCSGRFFLEQLRETLINGAGV